LATKKRIHELAKEYGVPSKDLVAKLQSLGFPDIKGPQSALDEFQVLHVQGMLEAYGMVPTSTAQDDDSVIKAGGLTVRKKKKVVVAPVEAPEPEEAVAPAIPAPRPAPQEPVAAAPALTAPEAPPPEAPPAPEEAPPPVLELEPVALVEEPLEAPPPCPGAPTEAVPEAVEVAEVPPAPAPAQPDAAPAAAAAPEVELVKPAAKRRAGKVVGFVDLSKVQAAPQRTAQSRKLTSRDDVAPDVQPTFGHDRRRALMRGDHAARGQLTASQLREKESARFLRRNRGQTGTPTRGPAGRTARGAETGGSPSAGGEVKIEEPISIKKLADAMSVKANQVLAKALGHGEMGLNINSIIDQETAVLLADEFEVKLTVVQQVEAEEALLEELVRKRTAVEEENLADRPPTIAFLGHVDHGKTTLLDTIRSSRVAAGESGGITQHIGAYRVTTKTGHALTILDTPGHEAFTAMRARGAQAVDIVVLVVAADDGVMPSTIEAINHANAAKTPMVVAINKIDKAEANVGRVKADLAKRGLLAEEFGGPTGMVPVSALKGTGVDELLERVFLESEVLELKSHPDGPASGVVLEAEIQEGKGRVAFLLVKDGTLNQGDVILAGEGYGRVRSIHDDRGKSIQSAGPSTPVEVSGLSELPTVGDQFHVVEKLETAREVAEERARKNRAMSFADRRSVTLENLSQTFAEQEKKAINLILRCDVQGSLEALSKQLEGLTHEEVDVKLLHSAIGTVTESDINLAVSSSAIVLAFRVSVNDKARVAAEREGVEIRHYDVIYELLDDVRAMMEGSLAPEMTETVTGHVEVRKLFKSSKYGNIAGCYVTDGSIARDSKVRVKRDGAVVHEGGVASLRREKDDAREVREGFECGIVLRDFKEIQEGDVIEAYKTVAVKRLLKI
jgi:translation initiation factor IF-2